MNDVNRSPLDRRSFAMHAAAYLCGVGIAGTVLARAARAQGAPGSHHSGITHNSEAIHQEVNFDAPRARVYELLTDEGKFSRVVRLSDAMKGGMPPSAKPISISRDPGGAFTIFGGVITGRHIEMVPGERLVQAWRPNHWPAGIYSIVRFRLVGPGPITSLIFDHTGFPDGEAQNLADGWQKNYWVPMAKALA